MKIIKRLWLYQVAGVMLLGLYLDRVSTGFSSELTLEDYKKLVLDNSLDLNAQKLKTEAAHETQRTADLATSGRMTASTAVVRSKQPSVESSPQYKGMDAQTFGLGYMQQFKTGTQASVQVELSSSTLKDAQLPQAAQLTDVKGAIVEPSIQIKQPLWKNQFGNSIRLQEESLLAVTNAAESEEGARTRIAMMEAEMAYYALSFARDRVGIAERNVASSQSLFEFVRARYEKNLYEKSDLLQTQAMVASRKLELQSAESELRAASIRFNSLRALDAELVQESVESLSRASFPAKIEGLSAKNRQEISTLGEYARSAKLTSELELDSAKPELDIFFQYGLKSQSDKLSDALSDVNSPSRPKTTIGLSLSMLVDRDIAGSSYRAALKRAQVAETQKASLERDLERDLKALLERYSNGLESYKIAAELEKLQRSRVENEQAEFKNGRSTTYSMLMANQDLAQAELGKLKTAFDTKAAESQLNLFKGVDL